MSGTVAPVPIGAAELPPAIITAPKQGAVAVIAGFPGALARAALMTAGVAFSDLARTADPLALTTSPLTLPVAGLVAAVSAGPLFARRAGPFVLAAPPVTVHSAPAHAAAATGFLASGRALPLRLARAPTGPLTVGATGARLMAAIGTALILHGLGLADPADPLARALLPLGAGRLGAPRGAIRAGLAGLNAAARTTPHGPREALRAAGVGTDPLHAGRSAGRDGPPSAAPLGPGDAGLAATRFAPRAPELALVLADRAAPRPGPAPFGGGAVERTRPVEAALGGACADLRLHLGQADGLTLSTLVGATALAVALAARADLDAALGVRRAAHPVDPSGASGHPVARDKCIGSDAPRLARVTVHRAVRPAHPFDAAFADAARCGRPPLAAAARSIALTNLRAVGGAAFLSGPTGVAARASASSVDALGAIRADLGDTPPTGVVAELRRALVATAVARPAHRIVVEARAGAPREHHEQNQSEQAREPAQIDGSYPHERKT